MFLLKTQEIEDVLVVYFTTAKILDESVIQQIGQELMECAESARQKKKLLLNFQGVKFMSSAMIGKLVLLNKKCKVNGVVLKMCSISPDILDVFRRTL
jgi:anti-anti-sigma factor